MSDTLPVGLLNRCSTLIFDFDGVILDSNVIKEEGFRRLFLDYGEDKASKIVAYHRANGGLSRYHKIRYFFTDILGEQTDEETVNKLAVRFSDITMELLKNPAIKIEDTLGYIRSVYKSKNLYIASASDEQDLVALCQHHGIDGLFQGIYGSPKTKTAIVKDIVSEVVNADCVLIGDSSNDLSAAQSNNIAFIGYNNPALREQHPYVESFHQIADAFHMSTN